jgi:DNA-binding NarL/FixJ family response regulator
MAEQHGLHELRIALAGGAPLLRAGIEAALAPDSRFRLVAQVADVDEAGELLRQSACDVLVLNTESPHREAAAVLAEHDADPDGAKVVVLTDDQSQHELLVTLQTGVRGYGIRSCLSPEDIRNGLLTVGRGFQWMCPLTTRFLWQRVVQESAGRGNGAAHHGPLSRRESEVLRLAAEGAREEQIAQALCLSPNTVKTYLRRIREKLQAGSRGEAVRRGYEQGLIPPPSTPIDPRPAPDGPGAALDGRDDGVA